MIRSETIRLLNGRKIGYADYGVSDGTPVIYFHGSPGSRIHPVLSAAHRLIVHETMNLRLLAIERPGYGLSNGIGEYSLNTWIEDMTDVLDALELERFGVIGAAAGTPFALACAHALHDRVTKIAIQSGMGPLDCAGLLDSLSPAMKQMCFAALVSPQHIESFVDTLNHNLEGFVSSQFAGLTRADRDVVTEKLKPILMDGLREATNNPAGYVTDFRVLARPWNIPLHEILAPVRLWYSDADQSISMTHGEYLERVLPNAELVRIQGYSHLAAALVNTPDVLRYLAED